MRGKDEQQLDVFSYISPEQRVPTDHPLRPLRVMTEGALRELQPRFNRLYAKTGRPSIAPEKLLRALLLQALYSVRSERTLMEQLNYNLLFRWFVGLNMDDSVWDVTVFTQNRERLLDGDIAEAFFQAVLQQARERSLLSDEHFTAYDSCRNCYSFIPRRPGLEQPSWPRIACRRFIKNGGETPELFVRQGEVAPVKQDAFRLAAGCLQHEIRSIPAQRRRRAINE